VIVSVFGGIPGVGNPTVFISARPPVGTSPAVFPPVRTPLLLRDHGDDRRSGGDNACQDGKNDLAGSRIHPPARRNGSPENEQAHEHHEQENRNNAPENRIGAFEQQRGQHDHNGGYQTGNRVFHRLRFPVTWEFERRPGRVRMGESGVNRIFAGSFREVSRRGAVDIGKRIIDPKNGW